MTRIHFMKIHIIQPLKIHIIQPLKEGETSFLFMCCILAKGFQSSMVNFSNTFMVNSLQPARGSL